MIDSGATFGTTPFEADIIHGTLERVKGSVKNLSGDSAITARGFSRWHVTDVHGVSGIIEPFVQVVPKSEVRLMSPQDYFQGLQGGNYLVTKDSSYLTLPNGIKFEVPFHHSNNLPMLFSPPAPNSSVLYLDFENLNTSEIHLNVADERNQNLSQSEKEFLLKHRLMSHLHYAWIAELMKDRQFLDNKGNVVKMDPVLKTKHDATRNCKHDKLKCAGCLLGKMKRRPDESTVTKNLQEMALREGQLYPGSLVHTDQYESSVGGRRMDTYGKEKEIYKYKGGTIFCDSMSTYIHLNHQSSLRAGDTLRGKHNFERYASEFGIKIEGYHADNGIFNSKKYVNDCEEQNQTLDFCGVGAHHQNGVAERSIQTVTNMARTLLIDAAIHWPDEVDLDLWPLAMNHAVWIWNHTPKQNVGFSPEELFTGVRSDHSALNRLHVWGCPTFVLEPKLQVSGKSIPKWNKRSRLGQFLGYFHNHSTTVGLVRNVRTGKISPQFHAVYDDLFTTVSTTFQDPEISLNQAFTSDEWKTVLENGVDKFFPDDANPPPLDSDWEPQDTPNERERRGILARQFRERNPLDITVQERERTIPDDATIESIDLSTIVDNIEEDDIFGGVDNDDIHDDIMPSFMNDFSTIKESASNDVSSINAPTPPARRSKRIRDKSKLIWYDEDARPDFEYDPQAFYTKKIRTGVLNNVFLNSLDWCLDSTYSKTVWSQFSSYITRTSDPICGTWEEPHPMLLSAKANSSDNPKWFEAMNGPYSDQFSQAARDEIETLSTIGAWTKMKRESWMNVLKSTWAFKIKRFPNGLIRKFKGRFCVRGDM